MNVQRPYRRLARVFAAGVVLAVGARAQPPSTDADAASRCRARADSLATFGERLRARADSLAARRARAAGAGDESGERYWLMRSEALAESIRAISAAYLAQRIACLRFGDALPLRTEFPVPEANESDPPMVLREKASYARDLMDRCDRWLEMIAEEKRKLTANRLATEAEQLLLRERLFDEQSALAVGGGGNRDAPPDRTSAPGLLAALLADMPGDASFAEPAEMLRALEDWLRARRAALSERSLGLEVEAERREREP